MTGRTSAPPPRWVVPGRSPRPAAPTRRPAPRLRVAVLACAIALAMAALALFLSRPPELEIPARDGSAPPLPAAAHDGVYESENVRIVIPKPAPKPVEEETP